MSDQQHIAEQDFNRMWEALQRPIRDLEMQVRALSRQSARAEEVGAIGRVDALGSAGVSGRIVYLTTDNKLYYDNGTDWKEIAVVP